MDHDEVLEQLELAAVEPDGLTRLMAGDTAIAAAVAGHLAGCDACAGEFERLGRAAPLLRDVVRTTPSADLRERTLAYRARARRARGGCRRAGAGAASPHPPSVRRATRAAGPRACCRGSRASPPSSPWRSLASVAPRRPGHVGAAGRPGPGHRRARGRHERHHRDHRRAGRAARRALGERRRHVGLAPVLAGHDGARRRGHGPRPTAGRPGIPLLGGGRRQARERRADVLRATTSRSGSAIRRRSARPGRGRPSGSHSPISAAPRSTRRRSSSGEL